MNEEHKYSAELEEKKSKNLLWVGIISIIMIFAGLTSAYLVVKSDNFWVEMMPPTWFTISTIVIIVSSITFYLALKSAKDNNKGGIKLFMVLTLILGIGFSTTQFLGWKQLTSNGYSFVGPIKAPGTYGENVIISKNGTPIEFNGTSYFLDGHEITGDDLKELQNFFEALDNSNHDKQKYELSQFPKYEINIFYRESSKYEPFKFEDGSLYRNDPMGKPHKISKLQSTVLEKFAENASKDQGYFFMAGEYGKDYIISYKGRDLDYKNGRLYVNDNELNEEEYLRLEDTVNNASSFVYILSALHLLHLIGGLIYILTVTAGALSNRYDSQNYLKIKLGSIFWHFLGGLWIYLYLFLTFIH